MGKSCDYIGRDVEWSHCDHHLTCTRCLAAERCKLESQVEQLVRQVTITSDQQCPVCCKSAPDDAKRIRALEKERDRYKAALERIKEIRGESLYEKDLEFDRIWSAANAALAAEAVRP